MLCGCDLCCHISALDGLLPHQDAVYNHSSVADARFSVVKVLHLSVYVVFLTDFRSQCTPHFIPAIRAQRLRVLIRCDNFLQRSSLFSTRTSKLKSPAIRVSNTYG